MRELVQHAWMRPHPNADLLARGGSQATSTSRWGGPLRIRSVLWAVGLMMRARVAAAQNVSYDYDRHASFAAYRTYAWLAASTLPADDLNHARIVAAVDSQLSGKGLTREGDDAGGADVQVFYQVGLRQDLELSGYDNPWTLPEGGPSWARAKPVPVGTLVVGMIDARSHSIVWRAAATKDLDPGQSPERWERNLNTAVAKVFKHYPRLDQINR